ncbi:MAG: TetR/AcrR family transcriptional regulator [bacterium]|nr:TetR/AcrR family transcriptional regulator [bacterium]
MPRTTQNKTGGPGKARAPKQARSRRTLESLFDACTRLLDERAFVDVTVKDIVAEAGSSAGSFYARFESKHELLHALHARMHDSAREGVADAVERLDGAKLPPGPFAKLLVGSAVRLQAVHAGLLRAVLIESLTDRVFAQRGQQLVRDTGDALASALDAKGSSRARRARAIESALLAVMAILDQELFYGAALLGERRIRPAERIARLERIALAAMNLPNRST